MAVDPDPPVSTTSTAQQVQIKLFTRHPDIEVNTGALLVPVSLRRYGLSQIINHLLSATRPIPFDFLIDGVFLRTSLDDYLTQNGLSSESTITLEYVRSILPPVHLASFQQDDWISAISISLASSDAGPNGILPPGQTRILSGSYDGTSRVWDLSGQTLSQSISHSSAIKSVSWISQSQFLTGSMDRSIRLWSYTEDHSDVDSDSTSVNSIKPLAEYQGHKGIVENISVNPLATHFLSSSADGTVRFWSTDSLNSPPASTTSNPNQNRQYKRRKAAPTDNYPQYGSLATLHQHSFPVSSAIFDPKDSTVAYSTSWDHTIRTYDLTTSALVDTRTTQYPLLSITSLPSLSLLACGSSARHITLHDPRASASTISTATLRGHANSVVALAASQENEFLLVSASHDGTVRVWDVRASGAVKSIGEGGVGNGGGTSLYTIKRESGETGKKVFDVKWRKEVGIVSCGEDKRIQINSEVNIDNGEVAEWR